MWSLKILEEIQVAMQLLVMCSTSVLCSFKVALCSVICKVGEIFAILGDLRLGCDARLFGFKLLRSLVSKTADCQCLYQIRPVTSK